MKYLLLLTACLCLIAAIAPASAYTEEASNSAAGVTWYSNMPNYNLVIYNGSLFGGVTKIEMTDMSCGIASNVNITGTEEVWIRDSTGSSGDYGYATRTWDFDTWDGNPHMQGYGTVTYTFHNATAASGTNKVFRTVHVSGDMPWGTAYCYHGTPSDYGDSGYDVRPHATALINGTYKTFSGTAEVIANFNATPLSGEVPLYVAFQDTSVGGSGPLSYNWSVSPDTGVIGEESTSEYPTIVFTLSGNYTITHCATDGTLSDCEEKTDYIWAYNDTSTTITTFWAVDPLGHRVWDSAISLQDVENTSWTNTSSPSGGVATITSLLGHTINGYATAAGYNDGETLGITADGVSGGIILMTPTNITNVSPGYVSLYVYAKESAGNAPISGAYINLAYEEGGSTRNDGSTTNTEGVASFVVPNNTLIYVYGEKVGYERVSTTKDSGSGSGGDAAVSVILYMTNQYVTPTVTATTGPGGTVPVTVDPRTPQEKESDIALILIDYGDMLVMFFIALTIIGGVKMIMK